MKRLYNLIAAAVLFFSLLPTHVYAADFLIPGGQIIGLQLQNGIVTVAAFDDTLGAAARHAGLKIGDEIRKINGQDVSSAEEIRSVLQQCVPPVTLSVLRNGKIRELKATPQQTPAGPRLGIHLKQGITGIGTVTWYDPQTRLFGTLGHGVSGSDGKFLRMTAGTAYRGEVAAVTKGKSGDPGLLKGSADALNICGNLTKNTPQGVFGISNAGWPGTPIPVADYESIRPGAAIIRSTAEGNSVQEYSVEILKIYPEDRPDGRNFLIKITDPELLAKTGGIVQGMSGSPIIQDGKLVGAVTHVLVNDPTKGYGIFIENMLEAAG